MNISIDRLVDMVSLRLGEYPDWRVMQGRIAGGEHCSLMEMCEVEIEDTARRITRELPIEEFSSPIDLRSEIYSSGEVDEEGSDLQYALPEDFCRLYTLRFPGWPHGLNDQCRGDRQILALGDAAPEWLRHRLGRPWMRIDNLGEKGSMLICSMGTRAWPESAAYIPLPYYDTTTRMLMKCDPAIIRRVVEELAVIIGHN